MEMENVIDNDVDMKDEVIFDLFLGDMVISAKKFRWYSEIELTGNTWYSLKNMVIVIKWARKLVILWYSQKYGIDLCQYMYIVVFRYRRNFW